MERSCKNAVKAVTKEEAAAIIMCGKPTGLFMYFEKDEYIGIDNLTGGALSMSFETENECIFWLLNNEELATA